MSTFRKIATLAKLAAAGEWSYIRDRAMQASGLARFEQRIRRRNATLVRYGANVSAGPTATFQGRSTWFYLTDIKPGLLRLTIRHSDIFVFKNRKSLIVELDFNKKSDEQTVRKMGLNHNGEYTFQYMGGGRARDGGFRQLCDVQLPANVRYIRFRFRPLVDRVVNIDDVSVSSRRDSPATGNLNIKPSLETLDSGRLAAARGMVVANIDLNVVDGSSIWLSSMASILCQEGLAILLAKSDVKTDVVLSNIQNAHNLVLIQPKDMGLAGQTLTVEQLIGAARLVDGLAANLSTVVCRGLEAAELLLSDRQFSGRADIYLTDFYRHEGNDIFISPKNRATIETICFQARRLLVQTPEIQKRLEEIAPGEVEIQELPPSVLDTGEPRTSPWQVGDTIRIGYSGKIAPQWGITELLDWVEALREKGTIVKLTIIGNKISGFANTDDNRRFRSEMLRRFKELDVNHIPGVNREVVNEIMREQDFSWCWRPADFEETTLELSTKLVEGLANGLACIAYPGTINQRTCGADYPFFVRGFADFEKLLEKKTVDVPADTVKAVRDRHDIRSTGSAYHAGIRQEALLGAPVVTVSCHDFKFIDPYLTHLRKLGVPLFRDPWDWGKPIDLKASKKLQEGSGIVFAEWGLANAVWQSKTLPPGKRLIVRIHLQEINPKAERFGHEINHERVDLFVFVSDRVRNEALRMFGWPREKTVVIPNFVLDNEYRLLDREPTGKVRLGMVGIIPQRKRFDRAIDVLEGLLQLGMDAELHIKGPRPESLDYMHAPGRREELDFYNEQYARIEGSELLRERVKFHPWGNDVAAFYQEIDYILSPSDFESFHYALADGVLSGCYPLIWPWDEAADIYMPEWLVNSGEDAINRIASHHKMTERDRNDIRLQNREAIINRYGRKKVFGQLDQCLNLRGE